MSLVQMQKWPYAKNKLQLQKMLVGQVRKMTIENKKQAAVLSENKDNC